MKARGPIWKIAIATTTEAEDAVTDLLYTVFAIPVSSYTDVETGAVTVATYVTENPFAISRSSQQQKKELHPKARLRDGLKRIKDCGLDIGPARIFSQKVRREDWSESWKRHFHPLKIGTALLVKPSWSKVKPRPGQAVITLDPGLSFGTGQHPTTDFCLRQLTKHRPRSGDSRQSRSLLDIGCGSGILGIAAARLGYAPVEAFDFDPEAVRIALENARKNRVSHKIDISRRDVTKQPLRAARKFDVVCANLISTLLIAERARILASLKPGGILVVAGILTVEFALVQKAYEGNGLRMIASRTRKEWRSAAFQNG